MTLTEQIYTSLAASLKAAVTQAVREACEPMRADLKEIGASQKRTIASLKRTAAKLPTTQPNQ